MNPRSFVIILLLILLVVGVVMPIAEPFQDLAAARLAEAEAARMQAQAQLTQARALSVIAVLGVTAVISFCVVMVVLLWHMVTAVNQMQLQLANIEAGRIERKVIIAQPLPAGNDARGRCLTGKFTSTNKRGNDEN